MISTYEKLTTKRLKDLHPDFRPIVERILKRLNTWTANLDVVPYIQFSYRSPHLQDRLWRKGRTIKNGEVIAINRRKTRTNLRGNQSKHCTTGPNGEKWAEAVDIALLRDGAWLKDKDPLWSLVPAAAVLEAPGRVRCGAMWDSPRDWAHVEILR